jgi:hypothetical protein
MVSSKGIHLELPFVAVGHCGLGLAILNYARSRYPHQMIGIFVRDVSLNFNSFERIWCHRFDTIDPGVFRPVQHPLTKMCVRRTQMLRRGKVDPKSPDRFPTLDSPDGTSPNPTHIRMFDWERKGLENNEHDTKDLLSQLRRIYEQKDFPSIEPQRIQDAAKYGDVLLMRAILALQHANPEIQDHNSRTLLSHAAGFGRPGVAWLLLMCPAINLNSQDSRRRSPLSYAAENGHDEVVWLFLTRSDVQVELEDDNGNTPLSHAAKNGHKTIVDMILNKCQTRESYDTGGRSPLFFCHFLIRMFAKGSIPPTIVLSAWSSRSLSSSQFQHPRTPFRCRS